MCVCRLILAAHGPCLHLRHRPCLVTGIIICGGKGGGREGHARRLSQQGQPTRAESIGPQTGQLLAAACARTPCPTLRVKQQIHCMPCISHPISSIARQQHAQEESAFGTSWSAGGGGGAAGSPPCSALASALNARTGVARRSVGLEAWAGGQRGAAGSSTGRGSTQASSAPGGPRWHNWRAHGPMHHPCAPAACTPRR